MLREICFRKHSKKSNSSHRFAVCCGRHSYHDVQNTCEPIDIKVRVLASYATPSPSTSRLMSSQTTLTINLSTHDVPQKIQLFTACFARYAKDTHGHIVISVRWSRKERGRRSLLQRTKDACEPLVRVHKVTQLLTFLKDPLWVSQIPSVTQILLGRSDPI